MQVHDDQHHLRNTLAVIRAMVRRTADEATSVDDYAARLDGRLAAYTQVQAAVARDGRSDLEMLIADELLRFAVLIEGKVTLSGPPVTIAGHAAGLLVLLIHELAGAYALDDGAAPSGLAITWALDEREGLTLSWSAGAVDWPGWLEQALEHQLGGTIVRSGPKGRSTALVQLPPDCCTYG